MTRALVFLALAICAACGRGADGTRVEAGARIAPFELPRGGTVLRLAQRSAAVVPGTGGKLRIEAGDVSGRGVALNLARADGGGVLVDRTVRAGDVVPFLVDDFGYRMVVLQVENLLVGDDWVEIRVEADEPSATAPAPDHHARIEGLLAVLTVADVVFIRNGREHSGREAAEHLRSKWQRAGDRVGTAEEFIEVIGSRSSQTGEAYRVRASDGSERAAGPWLRELLAGVDAR